MQLIVDEAEPYSDNHGVIDDPFLVLDQLSSLVKFMPMDDSPLMSPAAHISLSLLPQPQICATINHKQFPPLNLLMAKIKKEK